MNTKVFYVFEGKLSVLFETAVEKFKVRSFRYVHN